MQRIGEQAVVVGGSIAGLLAAAAAAEAYERVTVVDRDALPAGGDRRRAVPQSLHAHSLHPRGQEHIDALLPGVTGELEAAGAPVYRAMEELRLVLDGHELARASTGLRAIVAGRAFVEGHVRRRVRALPNVQIVERCDAVGLTATADGARVTGVRLLHRARGSAEETLPAELVVAATGSGGRVPAWLAQLGLPTPAEQRLAIDVRYASRYLRLPAGAFGGDKLVLVTARPDRPRALALFAQEGGRWLLTLGGYGPEHRPPTDPEGFAAFTATVAPPDVADALREAAPADDIASHAFPAALRRRYDRVRDFPQGLLVAGDAVCSFNPLYGQGMTVAAAEAVALRRCLARGGGDLARRYFAAVRPCVDDAWRLSIGADLALPVVEARPPAHTRAINAYLRRLRAVAAHNPQTAAALLQVIGMRERPPHLLRPATLSRVLRGPRPTSVTPRGAGPERGLGGVAQTPPATGAGSALAAPKGTS